MRVEQVFDYYVDLLHTRSEQGIGPILSGCDMICYGSLSQGTIQTRFRNSYRSLLFRSRGRQFYPEIG